MVHVVPRLPADYVVSVINKILQGETMLAYTYPLADLFGTMLGIFVFLIWFWLLVIIFGDIFRSRDMGGGAKALWVIFVIILPVPRHPRLPDRPRRQDARARRAGRPAAAAGVRRLREGDRRRRSSVDQLAKLADLKQQGVITDAEFEAQKAKLLS